MPTINLTDTVGVDVNAELNEDAALAKYLKGLSKLKFGALKFADVANVPLDQAPLNALATAITFSQPIAVGGHSEFQASARSISCEIFRRLHWERLPQTTV